MADWKLEFGASRTAQVALTGRLRWRAGILEQEWSVQDYEDGVVASGHYEWKPVPTVENEDAEVKGEKASEEGQGIRGEEGGVERTAGEESEEGLNSQDCIEGSAGRRTP